MLMSLCSAPVYIRFTSEYCSKYFTAFETEEKQSEPNCSGLRERPGNPGSSVVRGEIIEEANRHQIIGTKTLI